MTVGSSTSMRTHFFTANDDHQKFMDLMSRELEPAIEAKQKNAPDQNPSMKTTSYADTSLRREAYIAGCDKLAVEYFAFYKVLREKHPNFLIVMPEDQLNTLNRLTQEHRAMLMLHPLFNAEELKKSIPEMQTEVAEFRKLTLSLWGPMISRMNRFESCIQALQSLLKFQEAPESLVCETCKYPLFIVICMLNRVNESGFFNP